MVSDWSWIGLSIGIEFILGWIGVKVLIKRRMINKKSDDAPLWKKNSARVRRSLHFKISGLFYLFEIENCRIQVRCDFTKIITRVELLPNFTLSTYLDIFLQVSPLEKTFLRIKCKSSFLVLKSTLIATWSRKWVHTYLYFWLTSFRSHVKLPLLVT